MGNKTVENIFIIALIGIIACLIFPIVQRTIYAAQLSGIESSVYGSIDSVKVLYTNESLNQEITLPFTVKYNKKGYNLYLGTKKITAKEKITKSGRLPIGGHITINPDGTISVVKLKYEKFICSKPPNGELKCQRNS